MDTTCISGALRSREWQCAAWPHTLLHPAGGRLPLCHYPFPRWTGHWCGITLSKRNIQTTFQPKPSGNRTSQKQPSYTRHTSCKRLTFEPRHFRCIRRPFPIPFRRSKSIRTLSPAGSTKIENATDSLFHVRTHPQIIIMGDFNDYPGNKSVQKILKAGMPPAETDSLKSQMLYHLWQGKALQTSISEATNIRENGGCSTISSFRAIC